MEQVDVYPQLKHASEQEKDPRLQFLPLDKVNHNNKNRDDTTTEQIIVFYWF